MNDAHDGVPVACSRVRKRATKPAWLVYLLRCRDGSLYCGVTNDLPKRLKAHAAGRASRYTRSRLPVRLVFQEPQGSKSSALKREAAIKKLPRRMKLELVAKPKARSGGRFSKISMANE